MEYPAELALEALQSPLVDPELFRASLGGAKDDLETVQLYLRLPIRTRPEVSWFFDRLFYLRRYPDIERGGIDPLIHFLKWGVGEGRAPHPLVNPKYIKERYGAAVLPDPASGEQLHQLLVGDTVDPSPLFSREFYRVQLADSVSPEAGLLQHFLEHGILQRFAPCAGVDPVTLYAERGADFDIRSGLRELALGGASSANANRYLPPEPQAKALFRHKAESLLPIHARTPLDFTVQGPCELSVVMVLHNAFPLTLLALGSLRDNYPGQVQLVIVDSGSTDETIHLSQFVQGATLIRLDVNINFVAACFAAMEYVAGDCVLFLNNDVELAHDAVPAALRRIAADPRIGAVGAKIIRSNGRLQEAGCMIWRDGWSSGYLRDKPPLCPEANFVRDVAFCSMAFLLARTAAIRDAGGFDLDFAPAYCEDADLCLRVRQQGYRIVYDPNVVVHHLEYGSSELASQAHEQIASSHQVFVAKHGDALTGNYESTDKQAWRARSVGNPRLRVLFIEDQLPLRRLGSGFVRSNDIIRVAASLGYEVTVYPVKLNQFSPAAVYANFPDTVEVMHDRSLADFEAFLRERAEYYDLIWVCRTHNLALVQPIVQTYAGKARIMLDTEAIATQRSAERARFAEDDEPFDYQAALTTEFSTVDKCERIIAVTHEEADILRSLGFARVSVVGHTRTSNPTTRPFGDRSGLLFLGAIHEADSPNYDSLCWFADEVLPLIERSLKWETRLTVAGYVGEGVSLDRFRNHARITLLGPVSDTEPLYNRHRVFVAPTRYAAGLAYKVHEAASYGLPVIATDLLARQLGWHAGDELLAAPSNDPRAFADLVVALYRDKSLWDQVRGRALQRIQQENGLESYTRAVRAVIESTIPALA